MKTFNEFLNEAEVTDKDITRNYGSKLKSIKEFDTSGGTFFSDSGYEYNIEFDMRGNVGVSLYVKGDDYSISFEDGDAKRATSKHKGKILKSVSDDNDGGITLEFTDGSKCEVSITGGDYTYSLDRI